MMGREWGTMGLIGFTAVLACGPDRPSQTSDGSTGEGSTGSSSTGSTGGDVTVTGTVGESSGPNPSGSECGSNEDCGPCGACFEGTCVNEPGVGCCETDLDCAAGQVCVEFFGKECTTIPALQTCGAGPTLASSQVEVQGGADAIALADLDGDGDLDVALARPGEVEVLLGDGAGALAAGEVFSTGLAGGPTRLAAGDLDGDGDSDLAALRVAPAGELALLFGQDAKFMATAAGAFGAQPGALWLGDVDGDMNDDLLVHDTAGPATLSLRAGDGQGGLAPEVDVFMDPLSAPGAGTLPDGTLGVVRPTVVPGGVDLELLRFEPGGFAVTTMVYAPGTTPISAAGFARFEGSGEPDLFALRDLQGATALHLWYGGTTFHEAVIGDSKAIGGVGDVDGDGFADLVTFTPGAPGVAVQFLGAEDGPLCTLVHPLDGFAPTSLAVGDVDSDGKDDVVAAGAGTTLALLRTAP